MKEIEAGQLAAEFQVDRLIRTGTKVLVQVASAEATEGPPDQSDIIAAHGNASTANKTSSKYFEALARAHGVLEEVVEVRERKVLPPRKPKRPLTEHEKRIADKFTKVFPG